MPKQATWRDAVEGSTAIFQTRTCLRNGACRGHVPRRHELKKARKEFFFIILLVKHAVANIVDRPIAPARRALEALAIENSDVAAAVADQSSLL